MAIVVPYSFTPSPGVNTPTANDIIVEVSQDLRQVLASSGTDANILLSYVNRVQLELLRASRWEFLKSAPQRFVTHKECSDYWIGATGSQPSSAFDTGLNLSDVDYVRQDSVADLSNNKSLAFAKRNPNISSLVYPDGTPRPGRPIEFGYDRISNPNVLSIYPAPDNQSTYQLVADAPICNKVAAGALANRTYYVKVTLLDDSGLESLPSAATKVVLLSGQVLQVQPPQLPVTSMGDGGKYTNYRVYAGTVEGSETLQSVSTLLSTSWQEPNSGLVAGAALPTTTSVNPLYGYVIEFVYYKTRPQVVSSNQSLMIPIEYKDVIIAGVNALGYVYLKMYQDAQFWRGEYIEGQKAMIRDKNQFPNSGSNFIQPDMLFRTS